MKHLTNIIDIEQTITDNGICLFYIKAPDCGVCNVMLDKVMRLADLFPSLTSFYTDITEEPLIAGQFLVYSGPQAIKPKEALSYSVESSWTSQAAKPSAGTNSAVLRQAKRQVDYHNPFGRQPWCCLLYLFLPVYFLEA